MNLHFIALAKSTCPGLDFLWNFFMCERKSVLILILYVGCLSCDSHVDHRQLYWVCHGCVHGLHFCRVQQLWEWKHPPPCPCSRATGCTLFMPLFYIPAQNTVIKTGSFSSCMSKNVPAVCIFKPSINGEMFYSLLGLLL